jgi:putative methionine-R-sulfoxide reductase with GAF domain
MILGASEFRRFVERNAARELSGERAGPRAALVAGLAEALEEGARAFVARAPGVIGAAMREHGWLWNGFYVLGADGFLHLGPAHGPPVCTHLEPSGGVLTSGMCFDALHMNQTLVAHDAKEWPGYVSCDAASGLATVAGIVAPLRDPEGRPVAVWDLDCTQPLDAGDPRFMDVVFATASRCLELSRETFGVEA